MQVLGGGLILNFGRHFKKANIEDLPFGSFTKAYDHLNPVLGLCPPDIAKEGPLIQFKFCLHHNTRGPWNLGGGRYEEKEDRGRNRKVEGRGERKERRWEDGADARRQLGEDRQGSFRGVGLNFAS